MFCSVGGLQLFSSTHNFIQKAPITSIHTHTHTHTHTQLRSYTAKGTYMHVCMHVCMYVPKHDVWIWLCAQLSLFRW